ncbi:MAG TPA: dynamin family protein, partial [Candidatus Babeliales bacterium]|nr:dynamin family protein [Candidatus Babeliales bacterium]
MTLCTRAATVPRFIAPVIRLRRLQTQDTTAFFNALSEASALGIPLPDVVPDVVVVGDQSSGKTTVIIEALAGGHKIFQTGMKMATMKPHHIKTIRSSEVKFKVGEKEFRAEQQTADEITRVNNNTHVENVNATIWSPRVYNLSFIDTPGTFAFGGKNNVALPKKIKDQIGKLLEKSNYIICLIHSGSVDIATDHAFKLIIKYGRLENTIGIFSKMDLLDKQDIAFVKDLIEGEKEEYKEYIPFYGWHCLSLRSDKDIAQGVTAEEKAKQEKELLNRMGLPGGVEAVKRSLSNILFSKIKDQAPAIIKGFDTQIEGLKVPLSFLHDLITNDQKKFAGRLS